MAKSWRGLNRLDGQKWHLGLFMNLYDEDLGLFMNLYYEDV